MNLLLGALIVVAVTAVTVTAMLLVRRGAPEGSYFSDGEGMERSLHLVDDELRVAGLDLDPPCDAYGNAR